MAFLLLSFFAGYLGGWLLRNALLQTRPPLGKCNIDQRGITRRTWIAVALVMLGFFLEIPFVIFLAGLVWYESHAKWCIGKVLKVKR